MRKIEKVVIEKDKHFSIYYVGIKKVWRLNTDLDVEIVSKINEIIEFLPPKDGDKKV